MENNQPTHHIKFPKNPQSLGVVLRKIYLLTWKSALTYFPAIFVFNLMLTLPLIYLINLNYAHPYNLIPLFVYSIFIVILGTLLAVILVRSLYSFAKTKKFEFQSSILFGLKRILSVIGLLVLAYIIFFVVMFIGVSTRDLIIRYLETDPTTHFIIFISFLYLIFAAIFIFMAFIYTIPVISIEEKGAFAALMSSLKLSFHHFWRTIAVFFIALLPIFIIEVVIVMAFENIFKLTSIENTVPYILFEVVWSIGVSLLYSAFIIQLHDVKQRQKH